MMTSGIIIGAPQTRLSPQPVPLRSVPRRLPNEFYPTPPEATRALLSVETFEGSIWEPACGEGAIAKELTAAGHTVVSTDLVDYGFGIPRVDFLKEIRPRARHIVTNPPYGSGLGRCLHHPVAGLRPRNARHRGDVAQLVFARAPNAQPLVAGTSTRTALRHRRHRLLARAPLRPCALVFFQAPLLLGGLDPRPQRPLGLLVAVVCGFPQATVYASLEHKEPSMTKPTTPTNAEIIAANLAALHGRLRHASVLAPTLVRHGRGASEPRHRHNRGLERILPECDALYRTIMLLHRSRDSFEQNEVHS